MINKLREAEVAIAEGSTVAEAARRIGVTEQTFYRWRSEYGGLRIDQARRLKRLELENSRLKRAVAELTLDKAKPVERRGKLLFVDAAQEGCFRQGKARNYLDQEHIDKIVEENQILFLEAWNERFNS